MTWQDLLNEGRVEKHRTSRRELDDLRAVIVRDLADVDLAGLSADRKFTTAYNAALQSAKMVVACCGYRVKGFGAHHQTLVCLKLAMGKSVSKFVVFLDLCRRKRNIADYDAAGRITEAEAEEMVIFVKSFTRKVEKWIKGNYPVYG
ncbi:MAG: hypothetical protein JXD22_06250 [Sedimentisphaerales bacterium]|nr:hypothetical protein [Sedimentisphaerales bacterium]